MQAAVFGGDGGNGVGFVEHQKIIRPEHAAAAAVFTRTGGDVSEE